MSKSVPQSTAAIAKPSGQAPWSWPGPVVLQGNYVRLEPLGQQHAASLFAISSAPESQARFRYLLDPFPNNAALFAAFMEGAVNDGAQADPLHFAVINLANGRCAGRQALMRTKPAHGVTEIGHIFWGSEIARSRVTTEAFYLHARYVFETLQYRRLEWKCNANNRPSRQAALRFGFAEEGIFRQHMWVKGENRDTAWYAMLNSDWPLRKAAFEGWLSPDNFALDGQQRQPLRAFSGESQQRGAS